MWYNIENDLITINIKALPNSSKNIIAEVIGDKLKVKIKAPAVENAANKELVKFLSKTFKISKTDIQFVGGMTSKQKKLKMPVNDKIKEFIKTKENNEN